MNHNNNCKQLTTFQGLFFEGTDVIIGLVYIWIGIGLLQFTRTSEIVKKLKFNPNLQSTEDNLLNRIILGSYLFATALFCCGLSHLIRAIDTYNRNGATPALVTILSIVNLISGIVGVSTAFVAHSVNGSIQEATNALMVTPEGLVDSREATLLEVIENCEESIVVLSLPALTFRQWNKVTPNYFGEINDGAKITDCILDGDLRIFEDKLSELLEKGEVVGDFIDEDMTQGNYRWPHSFEGLFDIAKLKSSANLDSNTDSGDVRSATVEYRVRDSNKSKILWLESTLLLHNEVRSDTITTTVMLLTRDISCAKEERDVQKHENAAKFHYITSCAHDLKSPLQSFSSALDLLLRSGLTADQRLIWDQAEVSLSLMNLTISQTMDTSKAQMGYELVVKNVNCLLSDILTTVAIIIDSYDKSVPIYFSISNNICNEVLTDKEWVWQMLLNYLTNACKHTVDGSIHVNVSICSSTAHLSGRKMEKSGLESGMNDVKSTNPSENILFQIVDTGIGVDAKMHNCLFEVFSQAQRGQSTGTGLGLFSVYSRCKRLGGECGVVSPNESYGRGESNGSTFWFSVPYIPVSSKFMEVDDFNRYQTSHVLCSLCQPGGNVVMGIFVTEDDDEMMACPSHPSKAHTDGGDNDTADYSSFSAIIVDDMSPIRYLLKLTLEILGFAKVMTFENGERALEAMKKQLVDVVFMDVQMPVMTGLECVRQLRDFEAAEHRRRQCVISVAANNEEDNTGMNGFDLQLSKPLREKDIHQCMNLYLHKKIPLGQNTS